MAKVFNPIYDTVFKYLLDDQRVAKVLLGGILDKKITELIPMEQEHIYPSNDELKLLRIDFAATITSNGKNETVTIELQKASEEEEVMRFRKYLGIQYQSEKNADVIKKVHRNNEQYEILRPRHIYSIYILGHTLGKGFEFPVMKGETVFKDLDGCVIHYETPCEFIDGVTHHTFIIQIPHLSEKPKKPLEKMLRVFDQRYKVDDSEQFLELSYDDDDNSGFNVIYNRLLEATADEKLQGDLNFEREMQRKFQRDRIDKAILTDELNEAKDMIAEKNNQLIEKDNQLIEKDNQLIEKDNQLASMIKFSSSLGASPDQIAAQLDISIEEVNKYL